MVKRNFTPEQLIKKTCGRGYREQNTKLFQGEVGVTI